MKKPDYQHTLNVATGPQQVFEAVTQRIQEWCSTDYTGAALKVGDRFTVRFGPTFKTMEITAIIPGRKVEWMCVDQYIETPPGIAPLKNKTEWIGTRITWDIKGDTAPATLTQTHEGLTEEVECWAICEQGWNQTLQS